MNGKISINIVVEPSIIRKIVVLHTGENITDEEIQKRFFESEPVEMDITKENYEKNNRDYSERKTFNIIVPFVGMILAKEAIDKAKPESTEELKPE